MAFITVDYSFTNGTAADASQVNTNFTNIINGTSDGTKDFNISALTCAGAVVFNGAVSIGNASSDDLIITGSLASSVPIKTTRSYDIGSADLGLRIIYLGMNSTYTIALSAPSSGASADYTLTLPATVSTAYRQFLASSDASGTTQWLDLRPNIRASEGSGTTTLTVSDNPWQIFTLSAARTCVLPTTSIKSGDIFKLTNRANFLLTVQSSNGSEITTSAAGTGSVGLASINQGFVRLMALQDAPTTPAHWLVLEAQDVGTYTPTLSNEANTTAQTAYTTYFRRVNNVVSVCGRFDIDGNLTGNTVSQINITLPRASALANDYELSGVGVGSESGVTNMSGFIFADTTNDRARYQFNNTTANNREHWFNFSYVLL